MIYRRSLDADMTSVGWSISKLTAPTCGSVPGLVSAACGDIMRTKTSGISTPQKRACLRLMPIASALTMTESGSHMGFAPALPYHTMTRVPKNGRRRLLARYKAKSKRLSLETRASGSWFICRLARMVSFDTTRKIANGPW